MKSTTTHIFSSRHASQPNWAKQYKHADLLRIGAMQHRAFVIFITPNLSCLNSWNFYQTSNIIYKACHSGYEKDKYNKQLKPNCINLFLLLKLQTKQCHIIDLLHREFHKDSKSPHLLFYDFSMIYYAFPKFIHEVCKNKRKEKQILHRGP